MLRPVNALRTICCGAGIWLLGVSVASAQVTVEAVLAYQPSQPGVEIDTPTAAEVASCKVESEGTAWVLYGPQGQVLRRFLDTDNNRRVDEYRYYKHGIEVYRDIDTNDNNKVDQSRWLNTAGSRWGVDSDEDRKIDTWKVISAEEASREAILAMATRDEKRLAAVLLTPDDIQKLGITGEAARKLTEGVAAAPAKMRAILSSSKAFTPQTQWVRFDCSMLMPNAIPAEPGKTKQDLLVYQNVMAIIDNGGQSGFVQIGEMVRVGDAWKITQAPQPLEGEKFEIADGGVLLQPSLASLTGGGSGEGITPKMKELLDQLRDHDGKAPQAGATAEVMTRYNVVRSQLLTRIADEAGGAEEKAMWQRQRLEGIAAATQMGTYPNGLEELKQAEQTLRRSKQDNDLLAFAVFQRLLAEYNLQLQAASTEERAKVQENWLKSLEAFVAEFPQSPDSADALLQLAITQEFSGATPEAKKYYERLVAAYPQAPPAARARGALRRLDLKGRPLKLAGPTLGGQPIDTEAYRGKVLAVIFWATWCKPCTEDLPQIQELHRTHQRNGFEVIGVNLDAPGAPIHAYLQNFKVTWPHIHEEGALESRPAVDFGIISLPTMFLVDRNGVVVDSSVSVEDLKTQVPLLLKK